MRTEDEIDDEATDLLRRRFERTVRLVEAVIFASDEPVGEEVLGPLVGEGVALAVVLERLVAAYAGRGVELVRVAGKWQFRTAPDLAHHFAGEAPEPRKPSRAALEALAIIAYHQPITRAEIEQIRGVTISRGTLDTLLEAGWVKMRGRRRTPGRPVTWGTTEGFLVQFGLESLRDLPGLEELKAAGLLEGQIPAGFHVPLPSDAPSDDEDPLDPADLVALIERDEVGGDDPG